MIEKITIKKRGDSGFRMKITRSDSSYLTSIKETKYFTNEKDVIEYLKEIDELNWSCKK